MLFLAALCFSFGGYFMKLSEALTRLWPSVAVFALFAAGAALQTMAMKTAPMGVTYVVVLGLEALSAVALSVMLLGETVTPSAGWGILLVLAGIALLRTGA